MDGQRDRIETALGAMGGSGPRDLRAYLAKPGPDFDELSPTQVAGLIDHLLAVDPNLPERLRFSDLLRTWDNEKDARWVGDTLRNTSARRSRIHELLKSGVELERRVDQLIPHFHIEEPLVIAEEHQSWYAPRRGVRDYYWRTYLKYLKERRNWDDASLLTLENSTRAIVECFANPESGRAYASRGLVIGYVQSGKTANFTGVVARAADAGYRLIIVLAGTWNILRNQTQRRFDKDLLGKEILSNDDSYTTNPPPDWDEFLEHGADPVALGHYGWQRLTRPDIDFRRLKAAIDSLEFEKRNASAALYDSTNLHTLPAKLLVVKKHSGILANLVKDLKSLRTRLTELPTLIVDDESDQAGINTVDPEGNTSDHVERSKTNLRMVELLKLFPRGQYVGYTATPYANAFVNVDDPEDLFPRDFIVPLDRPLGYMGVSDFFAPDVVYDDLDRTDYTIAEIAHIRRVESALGSDDEDLKGALRSYVLSGGLKLWRLAQHAGRYRQEYFRHHTMLVHTSQRRGEQASLAGRLKDLWDQCAFNSPRGLADLRDLWDSDYERVSRSVGDDAVPKTVSELVPYLAEAIRRIESGPKLFLVVNSDTVEAPDFSAGPVWKIVVGGNKLSRGYTIEGLTISYYRRVAGAADTLMQMGRWFGFRPGYRDLVRVFLGVKDGKKRDTDLVALFKEVCRMEERFREEVRRYVRRPGVKPITPKEIPPLVLASASIRPTAKNKMFNAVLEKKNFGGQNVMLTLTPAEQESLRHNLEAFRRLVSVSTRIETNRLGGMTSENAKNEFACLVLETPITGIQKFLKSFRWLEADYGASEKPKEMGLLIEYLEMEGNGIDSWLIIAPQRRTSYGDEVRAGEVTFNAKERSRVAGRGFQVFGEPVHRIVAEYLAGISDRKKVLSQPDGVTLALKSRNVAVCLLYLVREVPKASVSVGFELILPPNDLPFDLSFSVKSKQHRNQLIVTTGE